VIGCLASADAFEPAAFDAPDADAPEALLLAPEGEACFFVVLARGLEDLLVLALLVGESSTVEPYSIGPVDLDRAVGANTH
jgi:hypothetical protein